MRPKTNIEKDMPDNRIGIALHILQQGRQKRDRREVEHAEDENEDQGNNEVSISKQGRVQERLRRHHVAQDKHIKRQGGNHGIEYDLYSIKPASTLAPIQQELQGRD